MLKSKSKMIKSISLPEYKGDRLYMHEFDMVNPSLPKGYERWNNTLKEIVASSPKQTGKAYKVNHTEEVDHTLTVTIYLDGEVAVAG
jgi:hypothetical protein